MRASIAPSTSVASPDRRSQTSLGMAGSMSFGSLAAAPAPAAKLSKEPPDTSTAENFLPRLLGRLASIDEKLNTLEVKKVDTQAYQQQMETLTVQTNNMAEQIRFLSGAVDELQKFMQHAKIALDAKAEQSTMERAQRTIQEMSRSLDEKATLASAQQLQAQCMSMDAAINQLRQALEAARQESFANLQDEVGKLTNALNNKADSSKAVQLLEETAALKQSLARNRKELDESDKHLGDAVERAHRTIQELLRSMEEKATVATAKSLQASCMSMDTAINHLTQALEAARQESAASLQEQVDKLTSILSNKAENSESKQLVEDTNLMKQILAKAKQDLSNHDQQLLEAKAKLASLSRHVDDLQSHNRQLEQRKPDSHMVPLLNAEMMERL